MRKNSSSNVRDYRGKVVKEQMKVVIVGGVAGGAQQQQEYED